MSAVNVEIEYVMLGDFPIGELLAFHRGWVDAQNGTWPSAYETMPTAEQHAYENGRLTVLNVMKSGPVPIWRGDRDTARGPVSLAWARSVDRIGSSVP